MKYEFYENQKREIFLDRMANIFKVKRHTTEQILRTNLRQSLRVNTLKVEDETALIKEIQESGVKLIPIPWAPHAYFIDEESHTLSQTEWFKEGLFYLQNASSLLPALALDPQEGEDILDLCAAPGGKAAHIAAITNNNANLYVNDGIYPRVKKMQKVLEMYDVNVQEVLSKRAESIEFEDNKKFDKILLDAQCSGEGMINLNHPRALRYWSMARIKKFASLQQQMIENAFKLLKPCGTLVYSTCTFAPEENEVIIDRFLERHKDASIEKPQVHLGFDTPTITRWQGKQLDYRIEYAMRIVPNLFMEGFFVAKIKKND